MNEEPNIEFEESGEMPDLEAEERVERMERDEAIFHFFEKAFRVLMTYQCNQKTPKELRMSTASMRMALGFKIEAIRVTKTGKKHINIEGPADLAKLCGIKKQTVNKCVLHFIDQMKLSPIPGQRDEEARKKMEEARKLQLEYKTEKAAIDRVLGMKTPL